MFKIIKGIRKYNIQEFREKYNSDQNIFVNSKKIKDKNYKDYIYRFKVKYINYKKVKLVGQNILELYEIERQDTEIKILFESKEELVFETLYRHYNSYGSEWKKDVFYLNKENDELIDITKCLSTFLDIEEHNVEFQKLKEDNKTLKSNREALESIKTDLRRKNSELESKIRSLESLLSSERNLVDVKTKNFIDLQSVIENKNNEIKKLKVKISELENEINSNIIKIEPKGSIYEPIDKEKIIVAPIFEESKEIKEVIIEETMPKTPKIKKGIE